MRRHSQFAKFIDRSFNEVLQLLEDYRDYSLISWKEDACGLAQNESLHIISERMRLTARFSEIMAWLMVQKAVNRGELTVRESQADVYRLNPREVYRVDGRDGKTAFPSRLNGFLDQSMELYGRVSKMDRMATRLFSLESFR